MTTVLIPFVIDELRNSFFFCVDNLRARSYNKNMTNTTPAADIAAITTDALLSGELAAIPALAAEVAAQFDDALAACVARIQANADAECAARGPYWPRYTYSVTKARKGQRFVKIRSMSPDGQGGVVGFVELGTGLLYKTATRNAPALNFTRGCIFNLPENWAVGSFACPSIR